MTIILMNLSIRAIQFGIWICPFEELKGYLKSGFVLALEAFNEEDVDD